MSKWVVHFKKSPYDIYIGRPSLYGNPYSHKKGTKAEFLVSSREEAISKYEALIRSTPDMLELIKLELKGKILGCWCAPQKCHGEVLARIANEE